MNTTFKNQVILGTKDGKREYLRAPSWDCDWYWGFGYLGNEGIHHHVYSIDVKMNMFDAIKEYYDGLELDDKKLWTFCELMKTFYTLKSTAELYHIGGSHYTKNPLHKKLKNEKEKKRINEVLLPQLFDEVYKLFV